ncbi:hypothetical protein ID866_11766 [Astraeus odoratus]|nr:hypothetical protein ID866_11766 [Astraeus odoratus]
MAPPRLNPHNAVQPDFASEAHMASHLSLMDSGLTEEQAITVLAKLWIINNRQEQAAWDRPHAKESCAAEDTRQVVAEAEERQRVQALANRKAALANKCKKHKSKYTPIPNTKVPLEPTCLPACYALKQMESGSIQSHPWHTSPDPQAKQALLSYQAKQWKLWHYLIGTAFGFSLAEIKEEVLKRTQDELAH